jgi:DNA-binding transcriptional LysR family regulator
MREASPAETFDSIAGNVFQAGLTYAPLDRSHLAQIPVRREQLHVVFRRDHFSKDQREIALADLRGQALITPCSERAHPALRRWLVEECAKAGFTPNIVEEMSSAASAFDLVEDRVGLAILPSSACEGLPPELESAPIANLEKLSLVFAFRRSASAAVQKIVSEIAKSLRNFERRRKIFFEPKSSPKRSVVPIDSKRSRTNNWKASSNA